MKTIDEHNKRRKKVREFKLPNNEEEIKDVSKKKFAPQSQKQMRWAVNFFVDWRINRMKITAADPEIVRVDFDQLFQLTQHDLCFAMCRFIREVKKINGEEYPPNTIREIVIMIQMCLHERGIYWRLLDHPEFVQLWNVVDNTMKERHSMGLGVRQPAEVISLESERVLFEKGVLGEDTPEKLFANYDLHASYALCIEGRCSAQ